MCAIIDFVAGTRRSEKGKREVYYIDPDVAHELRVAAAKRGISISELVENAIRKDLDMPVETSEKRAS